MIRSNPLKNPLGPLSEVSILALASDWPGGRCKGKEGSRAVPSLLYLWAANTETNEEEEEAAMISSVMMHTAQPVFCLRQSHPDQGITISDPRTLVKSTKH